MRSSDVGIIFATIIAQVFCCFSVVLNFLQWAIPGLFFSILVFSIQLTVNVECTFLPMTGYEPRTFGIGSDCSTNRATTTALVELIFAQRSIWKNFSQRWFSVWPDQLHGVHLHVGRRVGHAHHGVPWVVSVGQTYPYNPWKDSLQVRSNIVTREQCDQIGRFFGLWATF